ncbi:3-hydroxyacyl-CoA dehydrogenase family protein [Effusibacillus lacus]|nr:3-hydroxyacyl-CoA dehydrogenase family protein [Effusibacillus lacus]TCS75352.1 3-hydroxybutyryl-CoA dehydrogenase [Effusibacillus lacus]
MAMEKIRTIAVIGAGAMGSQIAMLCALAGFKTYLQDISETSLQKALDSLKFQMSRRVEKKRITETEYKMAFARMHLTTDLAEAVGTSDFIVEAIVEKLEEKRQLFAKLDELAPKHAILATNSSTIVNSKIATATSRPDKVCNMHFFNPPLKMDLVEVVTGPETSEETARTAVKLVKKLGKTPILLRKEISGFIANRLLGAMNREALSLLEQGIATHEEIDLAAREALGHPMGPFALMDMTGLDVNYYVQLQQYEESGDPLLKPSRILQEKFEKGELGRKSGKGFYTY